MVNIESISKIELFTLVAMHAILSGEHWKPVINEALTLQKAYGIGYAETVSMLSIDMAQTILKAIEKEERPSGASPLSD